MRTLFAIAFLLIATLPASAANFPYIRLNGKTNVVSDNGTNLTFNGSALAGGGASPFTNNAGNIETASTNLLHLGLPEPDVSSGDGPGILSITKDGVAQLNMIGYSDFDQDPELTSYRSKGTKAAPTDISANEFLFHHDLIGWLNGDWTYLAANYWKMAGSTNAVFHQDGGVGFELSLGDWNIDDTPQVGFHPLGHGIIEVNNGASVAAGGSLAQIVSGSLSAGSTNDWKFGALKSCSGVTMIVTNYLEVVINGVTNAIPLGTITP